MLSIWVHDPAADGAANGAVLRLVGQWLGLAPTRLSLVRGQKGRVKIIDIGDAEPPLASGIT